MARVRVPAPTTVPPLPTAQVRCMKRVHYAQAVYPRRIICMYIHFLGVVNLLEPSVPYANNNKKKNWYYNY